MNENRIRPLFPDDNIQFPESYRSFTFPAVDQRPEHPRNGMTLFNRGTASLETYIEGRWINLSSPSIEIKGPLFKVEPGANVEIEQIEGGVRVNVPAVGDITTAMNIGTGPGMIYRGKTGTNLNFRRLQSANEHLQIETDADTIMFTMQDPGETNTLRNLGDGIGLGAGKHGPELLLCTLIGSDSIMIEPDGALIHFRLGPDISFQGQIGLGLPQSDGSLHQIGRIRYNPTKDALEAGLSDGWHTVGTLTGTFLPLSGGTLEGPLQAREIVSQSVNLTGGTLSGQGMKISLEGAEIVSGLSGTIDGARFPELVSWWNSYTRVEEGILLKTANGFGSAALTIVPDELQISNYQIGIAENVKLPGSKSIQLPAGPDGTRDDRIGAIRYNSGSSRFEGRHPEGWQPFTTPETGRFTELVIEGNVFIGGMLNHRNFGEDLERFGELDRIRGIPARTEDGWYSMAIVPDVLRPGIHVSNVDGNLLVGIDAAALVKPVLQQVDMELVRNHSIIAGRTIDGRNLAVDGLVIDSLTNLEPGIITSEGDGVFRSRSITPSAMPNAAGLSVDNALGEGEIRLGLRLHELPQVTTLEPTDRIVVSTGSGNATISFADLVAAIKASI